MKTGFVFDLDGTLVDSIPGIARGLNLALKALGYPEHSVDAIREMVGKGARELCLASLKGYFNGNVPEEAFEAVHQGFMREYPHTWQEGTVPYPASGKCCCPWPEKAILWAFYPTSPMRLRCRWCAIFCLKFPSVR